MLYRTVLLSYYGLLKLKISCADALVHQVFEGVLSNYLTPFLNVCEDLRSIDFEIELALRSLSPEGDGWERTVFFDAKGDAVIDDFQDGALKSWGANRRSIFNPRNGTMFEVDGQVIRLNCASVSAMAKDLLRVVKQLIVTTVENASGLLLHASAVSVNGQALCFVGRKGQGKTTFLLEAMKIPGCRFITNDRLPLVLVDGKLSALGWFEELRLIENLGKRKRVARVLEMFPASLVETSAVRLSHIVLPACSAEANQVEDASSMILSEILSPVDPQRPKWLGFGTPKPIQISMLMNLPCETAQWSYSDRSGVRRLLTEMFGRVR